MNSLQTILCLAALLGLASAIPQNFGQFTSKDNPSQDADSVRGALDLSTKVLEAFADIPNRGDFRSDSPTSLQDSQDAIMRILEASRQTVEESERNGFDVPAGARERLEAAWASIPATFEFLKKLRTLTGNSDFGFNLTGFRSLK
ncbi:uncharacterized protein [Palaemon carinicauda]|uniref:uncharacterized protein n=1 Tax=Palaemon carinicauda TaxID=392227 RepID=UPI0035B66321